MGKKKKLIVINMGLPAWMGTFSDLVTLMMTFFIMLLAMASFDDPAKVDTVIDSIKKALGVGGFDSEKLQTDKGENMSSDIRAEVSVQPIVARLRSAMNKHVSDDMIRMTTTEQEIRIRLDERVFFRPGSSKLHPGAFALLSDVADVLVDHPIALAVQGHTDATGAEHDNWEISALRAIAVVEALRQKGPVPGDQLRAVGMGSFHPASDFGEDAAWNRRIELVLKADQRAAGGAIRTLEELHNGR